MSKQFHPVKNFRYAWSGISHFLREEKSAPVLFIIASMVVVAGLFFHLNSAEWIAVLLCIALVISLEMMNSALEKIVDAVSPEHNSWAGRVKDLAAGAVLLASFFSGVIGLIIFVPKAITYFHF